jgi:hypothetical protein
VPAHGRLGGLLPEPAGFQEGHCGADEAGQLPVNYGPVIERSLVIPSAITRSCLTVRSVLVRRDAD